MNEITTERYTGGGASSSAQRSDWQRRNGGGRRNPAILACVLGGVVMASALAGCTTNGNRERARCRVWDREHNRCLERYPDRDHNRDRDQNRQRDQNRDRDQNRLQSMVPRVVGSAQRFDIRVRGVSPDRVNAARVHAVRLQSGDGLVLDVADYDVSQIRYNAERRELLGVGRADFRGVIREEDLNAHLARRQSPVRDLRIRITPRGVQLRGSAGIPGAGLSDGHEFVMDGRLAVDDQGRLRFEPAQAIGAQTPTPSGQALVPQINPLVDLTAMRVPVHLRTVSLGNGKVTVSGRAEVRPGVYGEDAD